jgi:hypothetical protein
MIHALLAMFLLASPQIVEPKAQPVAPPKKATAIVPATITAKSGELVTIDASKAKGDVLFDFDDKTFDAKHAIQSGKSLILSMPKSDAAKTYHVTVISWDDKTRDRVSINVAGDKVVPAPTPVDPLQPILDHLSKIDARLALLEQIKPIPPPVPVDQFQAAIQAAYIADGKPAVALKKMADIYGLAPTIINNPDNKYPIDIVKVNAAAITSQIEPGAPKTVLVNVRNAIDMELRKYLPFGPGSDAALTADTRNQYITQYARVAAALKGIQP